MKTVRLGKVCCASSCASEPVTPTTEAGDAPLRNRSSKLGLADTLRPQYETHPGSELAGSC